MCEEAFRVHDGARIQNLGHANFILLTNADIFPNIYFNTNTNYCPILLMSHDT